MEEKDEITEGDKGVTEKVDDSVEDSVIEPKENGSENEFDKDSLNEPDADTESDVEGGYVLHIYPVSIL